MWVQGQAGRAHQGVRRGCSTHSPRSRNPAGAGARARAAGGAAAAIPGPRLRPPPPPARASRGRAPGAQRVAARRRHGERGERRERREPLGPGAAARAPDVAGQQRRRRQVREIGAAAQPRGPLARGVSVDRGGLAAAVGAGAAGPYQAARGVPQGGGGAGLPQLAAPGGCQLRVATAAGRCIHQAPLLHCCPMVRSPGLPTAKPVSRRPLPPYSCFPQVIGMLKEREEKPAMCLALNEVQRAPTRGCSLADRARAPGPRHCLTPLTLRRPCPPKPAAGRRVRSLWHVGRGRRRLERRAGHAAGAVPGGVGRRAVGWWGVLSGGKS
jgi:hypothetical protein